MVRIEYKGPCTCHQWELYTEHPEDGAQAFIEKLEYNDQRNGETYLYRIIKA
jgi:hypothetical protein